MEFSRLEDLSGFPFPFPGDLPNPGIEPVSPPLQADSLPSKPQVNLYCLSYQGSHIYFAAAAAATSLQSCPTLCDPIDSRPPGSCVLGILQARTLEWVAMPSPSPIPMYFRHIIILNIN